MWEFEIKLEKEPDTKLMTLRVDQDGESVWYFNMEFSEPNTEVSVGDNTYTDEDSLGISFGLRKYRFVDDKHGVVEVSGFIVIPKFFKIIDTPRHQTRICSTYRKDSKHYRFLCYRGCDFTKKSSCIAYEHPLVKLKQI